MRTGLIYSIPQYTTYINISQYITVYHSIPVYYSITAKVHYSLILLSLYPFPTAACGEPTASIPAPHKVISHAIVHLIPPNSRTDKER